MYNRHYYRLCYLQLGRYNEHTRIKERYRLFDTNELQRLAAVSVSRKVEDISLISKLGEGAANRAFTIEFRDGFKLVARIPYPATEPRQLLVASEAATMVFLRSRGIPVPEIYGYSASVDNPAKTEYIFMEFSSGNELSTKWADMDDRDQLRFVKSLVNLEARLFGIPLPANGSLYFLRDIPDSFVKVPVDPDESTSPGSFYIGPSTSLEFWHGNRSGLHVNRGPRKSLSKSRYAIMLTKHRHRCRCRHECWCLERN